MRVPRPVLRVPAIDGFVASARRCENSSIDDQYGCVVTLDPPLVLRRFHCHVSLGKARSLLRIEEDAAHSGIRSG
jgi:hypothetical protein